MGRTKLRTQTDQRPFTMIYHDFLESDLLNTSYQKLLYIYLKKFADAQNQCFPSVKKLSDLTKMSMSKVKTTLAELETKGVIRKENRTRVDGGKSSNLYTLYDYKELWSVSSKEEVEKVIDEYEDKKLISLLEARGYKVTKENVPETSQTPTKAEEESDTNDNSIKQNYKPNESNCQEVQNVLERYPLEQIKEYFYYEAMVHDNPYQKKDIDSVISILHTALNTTKNTIRIGGEDKPTMSVIGKLMKLTHLGIMYAIEKYKERTGRINEPIGYMLKLLYVAEEQMNLDTTNRVQYDMAHQNQTEEVKEQQQEQNYEENQPVNQMEQAIEVCKNYSKEQEAEYKERYKKTVFQAINQDTEENKKSFDKQEAINDLEKEWSKSNQETKKQQEQNKGISLPSEPQRTQNNETSKEVRAMPKCAEIYNSYSQRQYSEEFLYELERKLLEVN